MVPSGQLRNVWNTAASAAAAAEAGSSEGEGAFWRPRKGALPSDVRWRCKAHHHFQGRREALILERERERNSEGEGALSAVFIGSYELGSDRWAEEGGAHITCFTDNDDDDGCTMLAVD